LQFPEISALKVQKNDKSVNTVKIIKASNQLTSCQAYRIEGKTTRYEMEKVVRSWLKKNYKATDNKNDLIKCEEVYKRVEMYLKSIGIQSTISRKKIGYILKEVLGKLKSFIRKLKNSSGSVVFANFYRYLKRRKAEEEETDNEVDDEEEQVNLYQHVHETSENDEIINQVQKTKSSRLLNDKNLIKNWFLDNYEWTGNK